jgi:hypothetical protein
VEGSLSEINPATAQDNVIESIDEANTSVADQTSDLIPTPKPAGSADLAPVKGEGESPLTDVSDGSSYISTPQPQRATFLPADPGKFTTDLFTGSAGYSYQFQLPDGRAGLKPSLVLSYSSSRRTTLGSAGVHGWDFELGHIERTSKNGVDKLYSSSSTFVLLQPGGGSSELVPLSLTDGIHGTYGSKVESSFDTITFDTSNVWTVVDRSGTTWRYGTSTASRQFDPNNSSHISTWYVSDAVGPTGATMRYSYNVPSGDSNVYMNEVSYGGFQSTTTDEAGPFRVQIAYRTDGVEQPISYRFGFAELRNHRLQIVRTYVQGVERSSYSLNIGTGSNGTGARYDVISETRYSATGTATTLPPTTLTYHGVPTTTWSVAMASSTTALPAPAASCSAPNQNTTQCGDTNLTVADLDGDGRQEVIQVQGDAGGSAGQFHLAEQVYFLKSDGTWQATTSWDMLINPVGSANTLSAGKLHFTDVNGDSRADVLISRRMSVQEDPSQSIDRRVYLNNGHGWTLSSWYIPELLNSLTLADINGDGLPDLVTSSFAGGPNLTSYTTSTASAAYMNTGSGWATSTFAVPFALTIDDTGSDLPLYGDESPKFKFIELNGDGLIDVVYSWESDANNGGGQALFLNTGSGWVSQAVAPWGPFPFWYTCHIPDYNCGSELYAPSSPAHTQIVDLNGDGIDDILYTYAHGGNAELMPGSMNRSAPTVTHSLPRLEIATGYDSQGHPASSASKSRFGDFNGDGQLDLAWGYESSIGSGEHDYRRYIQVEQPDNLLQTITESSGASTTLEYQEAHQYFDASSSTLPLSTTLPAPVWVVKRATVNPLQAPSQITNYEYAGGASAYSSSTDRELAGFWKVTATSGNAKTITEFHQGLGGLPNTTSSQLHADRGQYSDEPAKRGHIYRTEVRDASSNNLISSEVTKWDSASLSGDRKFVFPSRTTSFLAKANGSLLATAVERTFDSATGREATSTSRGAVNADSATGDITSEISGDEATQFSTYASTTAGNPVILDAVRLKTIRNASSTVVGEQEITYDGLALGQVAAGKPTKVEDRTPSVAVRAIYDSYANPAKTIDARNATTSITYDATYHLTAASTTNPLGQRTLTQVDLAIGKTTSTTDPNDVNEHIIYDGFGRPLERWIQNPDAAGEVLAESWAYNDGSQPRSVMHQAFRVASDTSPRIDYTFADALGRTIQTRVLEATSTHIVSDTIYDDQGRVVRQSLPYRSSGSFQ